MHWEVREELGRLQSGKGFVRRALEGESNSVLHFTRLHAFGYPFGVRVFYASGRLACAERAGTRERVMRTWLLTLQSPDATLGSVETGETQFVVGTETAPDVYAVTGAGVAARHAWVWIGEAGLQVEPLGGDTFVNGHAISERVQVDYPASVQVGEVTLAVEMQTARVAEAASLAETIPKARVEPSKPARPVYDIAITIPTKVAKTAKPQAPVEDPSLAETIPATKSGVPGSVAKAATTPDLDKASAMSDYPELRN